MKCACWEIQRPFEFSLYLQCLFQIACADSISIQRVAGPLRQSVSFTDNPAACFGWPQHQCQQIQPWMAPHRLESTHNSLIWSKRHSSSPLLESAHNVHSHVDEHISFCFPCFTRHDSANEKSKYDTGWLDQDKNIRFNFSVSSLEKKQNRKLKIKRC